MVIYQQWIARALIVTWIWGVLLGSAVCASADEAGKKVYQPATGLMAQGILN